MITVMVVLLLVSVDVVSSSGDCIIKSVIKKQPKSSCETKDKFAAIEKHKKGRKDDPEHDT